VRALMAASAEREVRRYTVSETRDALGWWTRKGNDYEVDFLSKVPGRLQTHPRKMPDMQVRGGNRPLSRSQQCRGLPDRRQYSYR